MKTALLILTLAFATTAYAGNTVNEHDYFMLDGHSVQVQSIGFDGSVTLTTGEPTTVKVLSESQKLKRAPITRGNATTDLYLLRTMDPPGYPSHNYRADAKPILQVARVSALLLDENRNIISYELDGNTGKLVDLKETASRPVNARDALKQVRASKGTKEVQLKTVSTVFALSNDLPGEFGQSVPGNDPRAVLLNEINGINAGITAADEAKFKAVERSATDIHEATRVQLEERATAER